MKFVGQLGCVTLVLGGFLTTGCGQSDKHGHASDKGTTTEAAEAKKAHDHSGWWCDEHGIPEDECSMCKPKVAKEAKAKGDWCEKHDRAKSQCFVCDPKLKEQFAARYRAKYGKAPPEPTE